MDWLSYSHDKSPHTLLPKATKSPQSSAFGSGVKAELDRSRPLPINGPQNLIFYQKKSGRKKKMKKNFVNPKKVRNFAIRLKNNN